MNYYNEHDRNAAAWLRALIAGKLIPAGHVDERDIQLVQPADLAGYAQCHFFAGIGGWAYALELAGWPEDRAVWTGSCPCQPFSAAGKQRGTADERHLWPDFFRLVSECRPPVVFGEQVASPAGLGWLDGVCADLEREDYAVAAADLCAAGVGAPHIRQRLYWGAYDTSVDGQSYGVLDAGGIGRTPLAVRGFPSVSDDGLWTSDPTGRGERMPSIVRSFDGLSAILAGYGNAIVPQVAAEFVGAYLNT